MMFDIPDLNYDLLFNDDHILTLLSFGLKDIPTLEEGLSSFDNHLFIDLDEFLSCKLTIPSFSPTPFIQPANTTPSTYSTTSPSITTTSSSSSNTSSSSITSTSPSLLNLCHSTRATRYSGSLSLKKNKFCYNNTNKLYVLQGNQGST